MTAIQLLGTGPEFIREGIRGIEPVIREIVLSATSDIHILAYVFTPPATEFLNLLEEAANRSVQINILVNNLNKQNKQIRSKLRLLDKNYHTVNVINFCGKKKRLLHAKVVVVDRKKAVIGSANFTWGGMVANYEVGVLIEGQPAWKMAKLIDSLIVSSSKSSSR